LACAIGNNLYARGRTVTYTSSLNLIAAVKRAWAKDSTQTEDDIVDSFSRPDLLIIDELGKGLLSEREQNLFFRVIDRRYEQCRPMIGISNLTKQALERAMGQDAIRRLGANLRFDWKPFA
jgi:DNA replication protein DnaC